MDEQNKLFKEQNQKWENKLNNWMEKQNQKQENEKNNWMKWENQKNKLFLSSTFLFSVVLLSFNHFLRKLITKINGKISLYVYYYNYHFYIINIIFFNFINLKNYS